MTMPAATVPVGQSGLAGYPAGTRNLSKTYYQDGRQRTASKQVPVTEFGQLNGVEWRCRRTKVSRWYSPASKGIPVCTCCGYRMSQVPVTAPPLLPWGDLWAVANRPLRPVWALVGAAGVAVAVDAAEIPALVLAGAAPVVGWLARWMTRKLLVAAEVKAGHLEHEDPDGDRRLRAAIDRQARAVGYTAGGGILALAAAAALGVDLSTWPGRLAAAALLVAWLPAAGTWWRKLRDDRNQPPPTAVEAPPEVTLPSMDPDEAEVRRIWRAVLAVEAGALIGVDKATGAPVKALKAGRLPGTDLEGWHKLPGGWGATIVGPVGEYESTQFTAAAGKIASAFRMSKSMVTVMPDPEDESQSMLVAQRTSPITDVVRWAGPGSINVTRGTAASARYTDGTDFLYELWREGWGCPHDFLCGTTGAGKSEYLSTLLLIDRWAHHIDENGNPFGLVADLLIDPQQGQSYGPFLDDLAAPVATSLDEGKLMVRSLREEMLRRNRYLARVEWVDGRGRKRKGRKWWNPLIDGPILTLNIDEAHDFLSDREFSQLVTAGARMYRKCGIRIRVATHTPLLTDLGGSMALRSMLTGGNVWVGRTADSLSGPTAFNGRLPVDPRSIPEIAGMSFPRSGVSSKPMLARAMWEPDYYDWVRDADDNPIGFPAALPAVTLEAFGVEFSRWVETMQAENGIWTPTPAVAEKKTASNPKAVDAVLAVLEAGDGPMDIDEIDAGLAAAGTRFATRTVRDALKVLRDDRGLVSSEKGRHQLTVQARVDAADELAVAVEQATLFAAEMVDG